MRAVPQVQAVFGTHRPPLLDAQVRGTAWVSKHSGLDPNALGEEI